MFKCEKHNMFIPVMFVNDLIPDCPNSFDDELEYFNLLTNPYHSQISCNSSYELPCVPGHSHCFPLNKLCIYDVQHNSLQLKYCRNGAHLYNCMHFKCLGYFKCPSSYCVTYHLLCNGNWDCPSGHDEQNCVNYSCPGLFKCKKQNKCVLLMHIFDNIIDCIHGDDEFSCVTDYSVACPFKCICFAQSIICNELSSFELFQAIWTLTKYFKCNNCILKFTNVPFISSITFLHIQNYSKTHIRINKDKHNFFLSSLREFNADSNRLVTIKSGCFYSLMSLAMLHFQNNTISIIEDKSFSTLFNLTILNLSKNRLKILQNNLFYGLHNVKVINPTFNLILKISYHAFKHISFHTVHSFNRKVCCMSGSWSECKLKNDEKSNCNGLLPSKALLGMWFLIGMISLIMNTTAILIQMNTFFKLQTNDLFTLSQSSVDCLLGIYVLLISSANMYYGGYYVGVEDSWKESVTCKIASLIIFISNIGSPVISFVMAFSKFSITQWPITSKFKSNMFSWRLILTTIGIIIIISVLVLVYYFPILDKQVPLGICLLLYTNKQQPHFLILISLTIICVQTLCLISNIILAILLMQILTKHNTIQSKRNRNRKVAINLIITNCINMCCWTPSSIVYFLPIVGYSPSNTPLTWIIIIVVPINSLFDPLFHIILNPSRRKQLRAKWNQIKNKTNSETKQIKISALLLQVFCDN